MNTSRLILSFFIALFLHPSGVPVIAQPNWQTYPYSPPGSVLTFPDDDGVHVDVSTTTEWWYVNMHLIGSAPNYKQYDVMLVYFRLPANMRIFNIADPSSAVFHTNVQNFPPPAFTQQTGHWEFQYSYGFFPFVTTDSSYWTYPLSGIPYQYIFKAKEPVNDDMLNVTLTGNRPPMVVGGDGYVAIGDQDDSSFYYSYSNMSVQGTIKFNGAQDNISSGIAWIDRQWGPFTVGTNPDNMYEWFSLQMDNPGAALGVPQSPSEFNIWQIFSDSTNVPYKPESRLVSAMYPDETQDTSCTFYFERLGYWYDQPNNTYYSQGWRFINPLRGITIVMTPTIVNQVIDVTLFKFWEGSTLLKGTVNDQPVEGVGFAELVTKREFEIIPPSEPAGLAVTAYSDHYSLSWSAATQGTYTIGGYRIYRSADTSGYWHYIATTTGLLYDDYPPSPDSAYYFTVTSFDNQSATSASGYATAVHALPTGVNFPVNTIENLKIYPNPTSGDLGIMRKDFPQEADPLFAEGFTNAEIKIYDVLGREVFKSLIPTPNSFIHLDLSEGVYVLTLSVDGFIQREKLVLVK